MNAYDQDIWNDIVEHAYHEPPTGAPGPDWERHHTRNGRTEWERQVIGRNYSIRHTAAGRWYVRAFTYKPGTSYTRKLKLEWRQFGTAEAAAAYVQELEDARPQRKW